MSASIVAIGTAVPSDPIDQSDIAEFMSKAHQLDEKEERELQVLYRATGIKQRHSVIKDYNTTDAEKWTFYPRSENLEPFPTTSDRAELYRSYAPKLSKQAIDQCFENSAIKAEEITHLITVSCTGMYAPGLDIDIIKQCGLNKTVDRIAINFMGCYAAFTAIKQAYHICQSSKKSNILVICIELCTIHFQSKKTEDNLLANAIFSDGAAAFIMSSKSSSDQLRLRPIKFHNDILHEGDKDMAWNIGDFGYEMKLSSYVPDLIASGIGSLIKGLTSTIPDFPTLFAIHPGGKKILQVIEEQLNIDRQQDIHAHEVLRNYGNMSSPTVLFVLKHLLKSLREEKKGEKVLSLAFGPGLTLESMLLEVC